MAEPPNPNNLTEAQSIADALHMEADSELRNEVHALRQRLTSPCV